MDLSSLLDRLLWASCTLLVASAVSNSQMEISSLCNNMAQEAREGGGQVSRQTGVVNERGPSHVLAEGDIPRYTALATALLWAQCTMLEATAIS